MYYFQHTVKLRRCSIQTIRTTLGSRCIAINYCDIIIYPCLRHTHHLSSTIVLNLDLYSLPLELLIVAGFDVNLCLIIALDFTDKFIE